MLEMNQKKKTNNQRENKLLKENNELMSQQMQQQSNISSSPQSILICQIQTQGILPDQKISDIKKDQIFIKLVDQLQIAIKDRDLEINKLSQIASTNARLSQLINKPKSQIRFYNLNSGHMSLDDKQQ